MILHRQHHTENKSSDSNFRLLIEKKNSCNIYCQFTPL